MLGMGCKNMMIDSHSVMLLLTKILLSSVLNAMELRAKALAIVFPENLPSLVIILFSLEQKSPNDQLFLGFAVPATDEYLLARAYDYDYSTFAEELYGWSIMNHFPPDRFAAYYKGEWRRGERAYWKKESMMRLKEDGQFYNRQLVYPMNTTTLSMRVTETEVIWSWDGFAEGINTAAYSLRKAFEFVPKGSLQKKKLRR